MRLINADRLLEDKRIEKYYHLKNGDIAIPLIDIKHAPTIEERKKGKWKREGSAFNLRCPYCRKFFVEPVGSKFDFCPTCGADMRGDET